MRTFYLHILLFKVVKSREVYEELHRDFKQGEWTTQWQIKLNINKCKIIHIRRNILNSLYGLLGF